MSGRCFGLPAAAVAVAMVASLATPARAQEATNTPAATQPAAGHIAVRQKLQYFDRDAAPGTGADPDGWTATTRLTLGLLRDLSLSLDVPVEFAVPARSPGGGGDGGGGGGSGEPDRELGLADPALTLTWRPLQIDLNPLDSIRLAVFGGIEIPSMDAGFSSESWDPFVGVVFTTIRGRHGFNQSLSWAFNTSDQRLSNRAGDGPEDAFRHDTSYLYRLSPEAYGPETAAATYLTLELNGLHERNGDSEVLLGPGILYEARRFALEATLGFPVVQDVDHRAATDLRLTLGFRLLF